MSIVGANSSGVSSRKGTYTINGVPPGTYEVTVSFVGFAFTSVKQVTIKTDAVTFVDIELNRRTITTPPIIIMGELHEPASEEIPSTLYHFNQDDLNNRPISNFQDTFNYIPGVFENHFRGGRTQDVLYLLDGIPMVSSLTRDLALQLSPGSIEEVVVQTGGFSVEYGNANAGIVNIIRKRGRNQFSYNGNLSTDYIGVGNFSHDNERNVQLGFGGPLAVGFGGPVIEMNYFISAQFQSTDTPFHPQIDGHFDSPVDQNFNGSAVYDLKLSRDLKLSVQGAVSSWDWRQFQGIQKDAFKTIAARRNKRQNGSIGITHTLSPSMFYQINFGYNRLQDSVLGSNIDTLQTTLLSNEAIPASALGIDREPWQQHISEKNFYLHGKFYKNIHDHIKLKAGIEAEYNDVTMNASKYAIQPNFNKSQNIFRYSYSKFSNNFAKRPFSLGAFVESNLKYSFMSIRLGMRFDYFQPDVEPAFVPFSPKDHFAKTIVSPRLSLTFPLTATDIVHLNYGVFAQAPSLFHLYAGSENTFGTINHLWPLVGNPGLRYQKSKSIELSYSKQVTNSIKIRTSGFLRRYADLIDTELIGDTVNPSGQSTNLSQFINSGDTYARGLEAKLDIDLGPGINSNIVYTFMRLTGTANSPEESYYRRVNKGFNPGRTEFPLNWDQRHNLSMNIQASLRNFNIFAASRLYSPREWSIQQTTQSISNKVPFRNLMDFKLTYRIKGRHKKLSPFFEVRNLLNVKFQEETSPSLRFTSQPTTDFQDQFGRRFRIGLQIN